MATKGHLKDAEMRDADIRTLLEGMRGIMKAQGAKPGKIPKPKPLVKPPDWDKIPTLDEVLNQLGGMGVSLKE